MGRYFEHAGIASLLLLSPAYYNAYDAQDQLTAATPAYYYAPETYTYDATGNRDAVVQNQTLRDYAVGPGNRIASDGVFTYSYDAEGNLIYRESIADGSYTIYWYDYRNRILGTASCTAAGVNTSFSYFMYDAYDRLVRISRDLDGVGAMAATNTFFVHDGTSILLQFNGSRSQDLANRYLHAEAVDLVLADENLTTGKTHWMLTDHLGTIRHMVNFAYGAWQGARFGMQRAYDAFGQILAQGQPFDTIFAYTGQLLDKPTAMQYHQHRWYNPGIGRWMSEDPIGFEGGDVNLGRYVGNSSTNLVDMTGLTPVGHHWIPQAVFRELKYMLEPAAIRVFETTTRIPGSYSHGFDTWNGVTHGQYSCSVKSLLKNYRNTVSPGRRLSERQARKFADWIISGKVSNEAFMKANSKLFETAFKWRRGFLQSEIVARAAREAQSRLSKDEAKAIARKMIDGVDSKHLTPGAKKVMSGLNSAALKRAATKLPIVMAIFVALDAKRGFAGEGAGGGYYGDGCKGATAEALRGLVFADLVEGIARPAANTWADWWSDLLRVPDAESGLFRERKDMRRFDQSGRPRW